MTEIAHKRLMHTTRYTLIICNSAYLTGLDVPLSLIFWHWDYEAADNALDSRTLFYFFCVK